MNNELQTKARKLYFQTDLTKTEIALALGMPRRTLHHWIKEHNWQYQKQCATHMPVLIAESCYHILANYTQQLLAPERKDVMISLREVNTMHKLTITIDKLKKGATLNEQMETLSNFMNTINDGSPEMAQAIAPYVTDFISAGAAASRSVPQHITAPPTAEELEKETRLDLQYDNEEPTTPFVTPAQHSPVSIVGKSEQAAHRRQSPPDYSELLADFRRQDEPLKHLFPINTRFAAATAA